MLHRNIRQVGKKDSYQAFYNFNEYFQADVQVYENLSEEAKDRLYLETLKRTVNISGENRLRQCILAIALLDQMNNL